MDPNNGKRNSNQSGSGSGYDSISGNGIGNLGVNEFRQHMTKNPSILNNHTDEITNGIGRGNKILNKNGFTKNQRKSGQNGTDQDHHSSSCSIPTCPPTCPSSIPTCPPTCPSSCTFPSCSSLCCDAYPSARPSVFLKEIKCGRGSTDKLVSKFALPTVIVPSWMAYGGVVLNFYGYYQEPIPESPLETYRIHRCEIRYYMEDDTIEVIEPKTFDPGYPQGRIIKRCRIQLPPPCDDNYYTIEHLTVGCEISFYSKTFYICGCDIKTRHFLNKLGYPVQPNIEVPYDPATVKRQDMVTASQFARKAGINLHKKKIEKFLLNNRKVLRFWAYWDDRCDTYGHLRYFNISYYLEDDTIGITEILQPNSGYDHFSSFLGRSKLPKDTNKIVPLPGIREEALLILNVVGLDKCGCITHNAIPDRLCPGINEPDYYKDTDLAIGATINVYGRCFILTECDEFTKRYYYDKYGVEDFTPLNLNEDKPNLPRMETPPHIGIGDEEDTLANWDKIQISPPRKDDLLFKNDKDVLGFSAQLQNVLQKVNSVRRFVIRYFMVDGTIQIFEKEHPNTGLKKGLFLARMRVKKFGSLEETFSGVKTVYYVAQDLFVGATVVLNGFQFLITEADEFTLSYMEHNYEQFPQSNLCIVLNKMREACGPIQAANLLFAFSEKDTCGQGVQDYIDFRTLVLDITKCGMSEHELITLKRAYKVQAPDPGPDWETLKIVIQTELKRFNFDKRLLERIEYTLRHHDPCRLGSVDRETLRASLKGAKLPVAKELVDFLVDKYPAGDDCNRVNYCEILRFLDWETNGGIDALPTSLPCVLKWIEPKPPHEIRCINYRAFLEDICPNIKCALPLLCCPENQCESENLEYCHVSPNGSSSEINCQAELTNEQIPNVEQNPECSNPYEGWDEFYGT